MITDTSTLSKSKNNFDRFSIPDKNGRFGPYVKYDKVNATIPKDEAPDSLTLERGLELIAARIAKGPAKKRRKAG